MPTNGSIAIHLRRNCGSISQPTNFAATELYNATAAKPHLRAPSIRTFFGSSLENVLLMVVSVYFSKRCADDWCRMEERQHAWVRGGLCESVGWWFTMSAKRNISLSNLRMATILSKCRRFLCGRHLLFQSCTTQ